MNHPDFPTLLRYQDGELSGKFQLMVRAHLDGCEYCRMQLEPPSAPVITPSPAPPREDGGPLSGIRQAIRKWDEDRTRPERSGEAVKSRVAREIGPFLGEGGARQLMLGVSENGNNMLHTVERVLANFLGERAASHLVNHVVDSAILENNS